MGSAGGNIGQSAVFVVRNHSIIECPRISVSRVNYKEFSQRIGFGTINTIHQNKMRSSCYSITSGEMHEACLSIDYFRSYIIGFRISNGIGLVVNCQCYRLRRSPHISIWVKQRRFRYCFYYFFFERIRDFAACLIQNMHSQCTNTTTGTCYSIACKCDVLIIPLGKIARCFLAILFWSPYKKMFFECIRNIRRTEERQSKCGAWLFLSAYLISLSW